MGDGDLGQHGPYRLLILITNDLDKGCAFDLLTVSGGIIEEVRFFEDTLVAIQALFEYVKGMDVERNDAAAAVFLVYLVFPKWLKD